MACKNHDTLARLHAETPQIGPHRSGQHHTWTVVIGKGNRTFVGLPASELYVAVPGKHWAAVVAQLETVMTANAAMGQHYDQKKSMFPILN